MKTCFSLLSVSLSMIAALTSSTSSATTIEVEKVSMESFNVTAVASDFVNPTEDSGDFGGTWFHIHADQFDQPIDLSTITIVDPSDPRFWTVNPIEPIVFDPVEVATDHIQFFVDDVSFLIYIDEPIITMSNFGSDRDGDIPLIVPSVPDGGSTLILLGSALSGLGLVRRRFSR